MHTITPVEIEELDQLQFIARQTFVDAFEAENTKQAFDKYLDEKFNVDHIYKEFKNPNSTFYFLRDKNDIIGYLKINVNDAQTEDKLSDSLEVERIYLLDKYRGQGVGNLLMDKAINIAKDRYKKVVWLGVWEHNPSSVKFYQKYGFKIFDKHAFMMGDEEQLDFLMKLVL